jgi:nitrate/nitrite-specific signal transduction histidine kinase
MVTATVRDEGPGFDPAGVKPDRGRHVGLGLLRERARLSGGSLEVTSRRGEGTVLTLRLPRPAAAPAPAERAEKKAADELALRRRVSDRAVS